MKNEYTTYECDFCKRSMTKLQYDSGIKLNFTFKDRRDTTLGPAFFMPDICDECYKVLRDGIKETIDRLQDQQMSLPNK